jgi:hypothetical protein
MKCLSTVWATCFLALVFLVSASIPAAAQQPPVTISAAQAEYMQRVATAESIVSRDEAALGRKYSPEVRGKIIIALATKSLADISMTPVGKSSAIGIGDGTDNLVYYPVTPCRIIDTRFAGGPIIPGTNRNFIAVGGPFGSQGGSPTDCHTPFPGPAAVMINIIAISPGSVGDLRVFPFGADVPLASAINYIPGQNVANGIIQAICQGPDCDFDLTVQADSASTQMAVDILGYFMFPSTPVTQNLFAVVNGLSAPALLVAGQSFRAVSVNRISPGVYELYFDRDISNCAYVASLGDPGSVLVPAGIVGATGRAGTPNGLFIVSRNLAGANTDQTFHVHVMCPAAPSIP